MKNYIKISTSISLKVLLVLIFISTLSSCEAEELPTTQEQVATDETAMKAISNIR